MKRTRFLFFLSLALLVFAMKGNAQSDYKGHHITDEGKIYFNGAHVGTLSKNGVITDAEGHHIALLNKEGLLVSPEGKVLGHKGKEGRDYESIDGEIILTVHDVDKDKVEIRDKTGKVIGYAHPTYKNSVSILHCFLTGTGKK